MSAEKVIDPIINGVWQSKIFSVSVACLIVSNALEKSKANTRMNGCMVNMVKTVCRRVIRAASVEPVGRNAN